VKFGARCATLINGIRREGYVAIVILSVERPSENEPWRVRATVDGEEHAARVVVNADASCVFIEQSFSELLAQREREERGKATEYRNAVQKVVRAAVNGKPVSLPLEIGKVLEPKRRWWFWRRSSE
jgi:hypothetical protein